MRGKDSGGNSDTRRASPRSAGSDSVAALSAVTPHVAWATRAGADPVPDIQATTASAAITVGGLRARTYPRDTSGTPWSTG